MSAIEEAKAAGAVAAKKSYKDIYQGPATVKEVNALEPRFTDGLTEEEAAMAFDIQLVVTPQNADVGEQEVIVSHSARHPKFNLDKTEAQIALSDLTKQGLVQGGDISTVFASVGKTCAIRVYEETNAKGTFTRCKLAFGAAKLTQNELMQRIRAMTGAKPAAAPAKSANPFG